MLSQADNELLTRTGAGTPMGELFRRFWQPVLLSPELPAPDGPPVRVQVLGENLIAFRDTDGRVGLVDPVCPHRGGPLDEAPVEAGCLTCPWHGYRFDVRTGRSADGRGLALRSA